jgi:DnaJ domain/PilZ domain
MGTTPRGQRRKTGRKAASGGVIGVELKDGMGNPRWVTADLIDRSESGISVSLLAALKVGSIVQVRGKLGEDGENVRMQAGVVWCQESVRGEFRAGLELLAGKAGHTSRPEPEAAADSEEPDLYEVMQLSPNADTDTINRVYRILAQRYHPDNAQTGSPELFVRLTEAHRILSDAEERAGYDARHRQTKRRHWQVFDQTQAPTGMEAERRKRQGILELLYVNSIQDPDRATMTIHAFEELLGCPREHLEAALWYLRGKGLIQRTDNGRYKITVEGFDEAERGSGAARTKDVPLLEPVERK